MNHSIFVKCVAVIHFLFTISSGMQSASTDDTLSVRARFTENLHTAGDTAVRIEKKVVDSLSQTLGTLNRRHLASLKILKDSLLSSTGKTLDPKRTESVNKLLSHLSGNLSSYSQSRQKLMHEKLQKYQRTIRDIMAVYLPCQTCKGYGDYENALNIFQEKTDASTDAFFEAASDEHEKASDAITETADTMCDSLISYVETLVDDRSTELEENEERYSKIIISVDAKGHNSYLGRDGGISQASLSPSLLLALSSGLRFSIGAAWIEEPEFHRDGTYLGIGYDFNILPIMCASFSYTYLSYEDSSTQNQSVFNHSIDGGIYLETPVVNFNGNVGIYIGNKVEYTIIAGISRSIPIGIVSLDPSFTISWGEQNGELIAERLEKTQTKQGKGQGKGNGNGGSQTVTTTIIPQNVFSIMAYEISLPLNIHLGKFTATPSVSGIFSMNVNDGSREIPYLNAGLIMSYEFRL